MSSVLNEKLLLINADVQILLIIDKSMYCNQQWI